MQPPNKFKYQVSEKAWAHFKNYVGRKYLKGRSIKDLLQQTIEGLYGGGEVHGVPNTPITAKSVKGWAKHCYRAMIEDAVELDLFEDPIPDAKARKELDLPQLKAILMKLYDENVTLEIDQPQNGVELDLAGESMDVEEAEG